MHKEVAWFHDAIFYELYIRAYKDTDGDGHGDLRGVIEKLDYVKSLGVDCIWLLPMYPSPLKDDGYDIADYYNIHPDYGTLEDFELLLEEAHARGLRIITDLVVNHTSDQHEWFIESRSSRESPKRDWYVWSDTDQRYAEARVIFLDTLDSNWTYDEATGQYYWHRFYPSQPDLNYDNPEVQQAMLDVMHFWLDKGIDGFRVDAVPYLYEREGTNCENLPETHQYLKRMRHELDDRGSDAVLLCEANQPPQEVVEYLGDGDEFHMAFNFPVMPRIFMALRSGDATKLREIIAQTPPIPPGTTWCNFLRNHDELTLEMVTPEERQWMWEQYAPEPRMRLNLGIRRRLAPLLDNNMDKILLANRIMFSLPGAPIIYYGDEIGMGDNIYLPDRDGVRTPMQWDASPNAGFSDAPPDKLYAPVIDDPIYGYQTVNVAAQEEDPNSLLNRMRTLISLRKRHPAFARGDFEFLECDNPAVLAFVRSYRDQVIVVVHNVSGETQPVDLDLSKFAGRSACDILQGEDYPVIGRERYRLDLPPYQSRWLKLEG
ncbi:MAG TPA: maltose alpha-D-glucosyltransferase [Aggregatilineales bacterium]|mgnify:CR=1 FL=1|nr:maltose alpha-D-glucosyltransferase [Chloroflexota bacterium]HOA25045.1 maltose alpha-D-glucosyltransferase [Aggregatilineales bacterium]HPV07856.1 maltose alpha-D-glucosyltransferase [Aggregatilineales bacterium]HQA67968.1 maltose alpha-D-glucosyltransferase [Aggregatilineales bacterium]HQE18463.1 maltose alpha-D-glucosyltransferase [Aggregatilineales bacterium]